MNFERAYRELLANKKIRRKAWEPLMHLRLVEKEVKTFHGETINFFADSNILISKGWKIVDGDDTEMSFLEALEELKQKKCITNDTMKDSYIFIDNGQWAICRPVEYQFMPTYQCLMSIDWEVLK
jgi:hypothetical protein